MGMTAELTCKTRAIPTGAGAWDAFLSEMRSEFCSECGTRSDSARTVEPGVHEGWETLG
jgi:hypothetical protein